MTPPSPIFKILDHARWAPSGDNVQPWRFRILSDVSAEVIIVPNHDCVLEVGNISLLESLGAFIETARIAASQESYALDISELSPNSRIESITSCRITLVPRSDILPDPLHQPIETRSVARGLYTRRALTPEDCAALQQAVGDQFELRFLEGRDKRRLFKVHWINNKIRMCWRGIFDNYNRTIMWGEKYAPQYLPSHALGMSPPTHTLFRNLLKNWTLFQIVIRYMGGILSSFIEIDLMPNIFCASNVLLIAKKMPRTDDDFIATGAAIQRFWLTATARGILHQPNFMPIAMNAHAVHGIPDAPDVDRLARVQRAEWVRILEGDEIVDRLVWTGRVGYGTPGKSRSLRLPMDQLVIQ